MKNCNSQPLAVLAAAAALTAGTVAIAPTASADTPGCVSRHEFQRVQKGMSKHRVHAIFDTRGDFGDGYAGGYSRVYPTCAPAHYAQIDYLVKKGVAHVHSKHWYRQEG